MKRRTLLATIVKLFSLGAGTLLALPPIRFIIGALSERENSLWRTVLTTRDAAFAEEVVLVRFNRVIRDGWLTRTVEEFVWVRKKQDQTFDVFDVHCTHLGCAVNWNGGARQFECPCHGGKFDSDGKRIAGPPPRPLDLYETRVERDALQIGRLRKRT